MIWRAGRSSQVLYLVHKEWHKHIRTEHSLSLLIKISLVCRAAAFHYAKELELIALASLNINLGRKVAL